MDADWKPVFVTVRRIYSAAIGFVGLVALMAVRIHLFQSDVPIETDGALLWAIRGLLALLVVTELGVVEFILRSKRAPSEVPEAAGRDGPPTAQKLATDTILAAAFYVSPAIYGLLLVLLGGHWSDALVFAAVSWLLLAWKFPRESRWHSAMNESKVKGLRTE